MDRTPIVPPPLAAGARVALVAPAGPLRDEADVERAIANTRALGWEPMPGAHLRAHHGYVAGTDAERAADVNAAIRDPRIDAIWCVRGGYGSARILDAIDYDALRAHPKTIVGYSDITALHCAIWARARLVTYHGPTGRGALSDFSRASLERAVTRGSDPCGTAPNARALAGGSARGRIAGGNLALVASLVGTPYALDPAGAILFFEDVNEPTYRIDRMLTQLRLAGVLAKCRGLIFGQFTERTESADDAAMLDEVMRGAAAAVDGPCFMNAPIGHVADQWTIPLGVDVTVEVSGQRSDVRVTSANRGSP
ncbi:MAG: LD-carboxypeptidase [Gemmatimonadaceae bacterium]